MVTLAAVAATVRPNSLMNIVVLGQIKFRLEAFRTLGTLYRPRIGMGTTYVLHHVGLADKLGVTNDAGVLLDTEMRFHVHRALVPTLVKLVTELTRVAVLVVVGNVFDVIVHLNLLAVDAK